MILGIFLSVRFFLLGSGAPWNTFTLKGSCCSISTLKVCELVFVLLRYFCGLPEDTIISREYEYVAGVAS